MKHEFIEIKMETSDIISNVNDYFENSFDWVNFSYSDIDDSNIDYLKSLIPATKQKFLKIEDVREQFKYDVRRTVEQAYINSMESNLANKIDYYIRETLCDYLPLDYVSFTGFFYNDQEAKTLTFCDYIIIKFKRIDVIQFQRSRNYWDRINSSFEEEIIEVILENKRNFDYGNLDASYNWDNKEELKQIWNDYNETIPAINSIIEKKRNKLKDLINTHVSILNVNIF